VLLKNLLEFGLAEDFWFSFSWKDFKLLNLFLPILKLIFENHRRIFGFYSQKKLIAVYLLCGLQE